jgi:hypothetical protein
MPRKTQQNQTTLTINLFKLTEGLFSLSILVGLAFSLVGNSLLNYYFLTAWWLIPLSIANLALSVISQANTFKKHLLVFVLSLSSLIPSINFFSLLLAGLVILLNLKSILSEIIAPSVDNKDS